MPDAVTVRWPAFAEEEMQFQGFEPTCWLLFGRQDVLTGGASRRFRRRPVFRFVEDDCVDCRPA